MKGKILSLYSAHISERMRKAEEILSLTSFDAFIIYSGTPLRYYADDQDAPFRAYAHFAHWTPLNEPGNFLLIRPNVKPVLIRVRSDDFWHEQTSLKNNFWLSEFDFREVPNVDSAWQVILNERLTKSFIEVAYIGDNSEDGKKRGIVEDCINPSELIATLDKSRSFKTEYEIECISKANEIAAKGHAVAKQMFLTGASELAIHQVYMYGVGCTEKELPYETIVALNEKGATLHYQGKRSEAVNGKSLLLDAGANYNGYASDVTRTFVAPDADPLFVELVAGVEKLQQELCALAKPGLPFAELQKEAHLKIGNLLSSFRILNVTGEEAVSIGLTKSFFPHGIGHMLGLQVHDVGGAKKDSAQTADMENLRTRGVMEVGQVFTVEPGVYFIEMLFRPHRDGDTAKHFNWELIDRLVPYGGVRIEDDVLLAHNGIRNLTREYFE